MNDYDYRDNAIDPAVPARPNPQPRPKGFNDFLNAYCEAMKNGTPLPKPRDNWNGDSGNE